jgi:hypothetical protein
VSGQLYFPARRLLRLLGKHSQYHDALTGGGDVKSPGDPAPAAEAHLPDRAVKVLDVWFPHLFEPERLNELNDAFKAGSHVHGHRIEFGLRLRAYEGEEPCHQAIYLFCNGPFNPDEATLSRGAGEGL